MKTFILILLVTISQVSAAGITLVLPTDNIKSVKTIQEAIASRLAEGDSQIRILKNIPNARMHKLITENKNYCSPLIIRSDKWVNSYSWIKDYAYTTISIYSLSANTQSQSAVLRGSVFNQAAQRLNIPHISFSSRQQIIKVLNAKRVFSFIESNILVQTIPEYKEIAKRVNKIRVLQKSNISAACNKSISKDNLDYFKKVWTKKITKEFLIELVTPFQLQDALL